jgi:hypothetical protein
LGSATESGKALVSVTALGRALVSVTALAMVMAWAPE